MLVAALLDVGPYGQWSESILAAGPLHAPELSRVEASNVVRRLERARKISVAEANASFADLMQLDIELFNFEPSRSEAGSLRHVATT